MNASAIALVLSVVALGVAVYPRDDPKTTARKTNRVDRIVALERRVADLSAEVATWRARADHGAHENNPSLPSLRVDGENATEDRGNVPGDPRATPGKSENSALAAIVDDAVDRKTRQVMEEIRIKANKKPDIAVFAKMLELTPEQRRETEQVVADGQRRVHEALNIPTASGANLMDELVDIVAKGIAEPGKDHGLARLFGKITTENIPGTNTTYAAQIESVKAEMRSTFRQSWSKKQYEEYEQWRVDPTEVANVKDSPNVALMQRITDRAREFGAKTPESKER